MKIDLLILRLKERKSLALSCKSRYGKNGEQSVLPYCIVVLVFLSTTVLNVRIETKQSHYFSCRHCSSKPTNNIKTYGSDNKCFAVF